MPADVGQGLLASPPDPMRILKPGCNQQNMGGHCSCITTRSDEDTETYLAASSCAGKTHLASPPDPMRILKPLPRPKWRCPFHPCITTRSDEDTETPPPLCFHTPPHTCITTRSDEDTETWTRRSIRMYVLGLHHHPIR